MKYLLTVILLFSFGQAGAITVYYSGSKLLELCEARYKEDTAENIAEGNVCYGL
jgi:hypothetical protein